MKPSKHADKRRIPLEIPPEEERDPDQAWFWTEEWQAAEREADDDLANGRYKTFDTMEEFLADLDSDEDD